MAPYAVKLSEALTSAHFTKAAFLDQRQRFSSQFLRGKCRALVPNRRAVRRPGRSSSPLPRSGGSLLSPAREGGNKGAENRTKNDRPPNPHRQLRQDGRVEILPPKRQVREHGIHGIVMCSPASATISAHGTVHHDQYGDARRKSIRKQNSRQRASSDEGHKSRNQHEEERGQGEQRGMPHGN